MHVDEQGNPQPRLSALLSSSQQDVLHTTEDPLRLPPVLAADGSQEASSASLRKRLSGQLCSRPALLSPRKLVSPDLWPMPHAEPRATRSPSSPSSLHRLLPTYHPLTPSTRNRAREYEKPAAYAPFLVQRALQSWMTIKKTEISAQHEFLKPIYLCVHRGIVLIYLDVHQKC